MAVASFIAVWATFRTKVEILEKQVNEYAILVRENRTRIERRDEEMAAIHKHLNAIADLKLEAALAEIKAELGHIRALLESRG